MKFKVGDKVVMKANKSFSYIGISECVVNSYRYKTYTVERTETINGKEWIRFEGDCYNWAQDMFELVHETQSIVIYRRNNEVIATLKSGKQTIKTAKAKCNPADEFNFDYGAKLAFQRLIGDDTKAVKEAHRPAKVMEWIKIINPQETGNKYSKGDILQVSNEAYCDGVKVSYKGQGNGICGGYLYIRHNEYVVLENYKPYEDNHIYKPLSEYTNRELSAELLRRYEQEDK